MGQILNVDQNILDLGENKLNITYPNIQIFALFLLIFLFGSFSSFPLPFSFVWNDKACFYSSIILWVAKYSLTDPM